MSRIQIFRAGGRFVTRGDGIEAWHSFSFGVHYDPTNTSYGALVAHNDEQLAPAAGYDDHPHRDVDIVTWVIEGALRHRDSIGGDSVVRPGTCAILHAGRGVRHSEVNASSQRSLRFVQAWLPPSAIGGEPDYQLRDVADELSSGGFVPVVKCEGGADADAATLHVARVRIGESVVLPESELLHLFVARGAVDAATIGVLRDGDAARIERNTGVSDHLAVTAVASGSETTRSRAEVMVWAMAPQPRTRGSTSSL